MYSRIQLLTVAVGSVGTAIMLYLTKQFHDMDAGYLPYFAFLGAFICISIVKGVLLSPEYEQEVE